MAPNFYEYPHLYDALKAPPPEEVNLLWALIERRVGPGPWHMLDPACGPGNWLRPFQDGRNTLVGNDYCSEMVTWVRRRLDPTTCRAMRADMYELGLGDERFDIVFEASGVTSIVPTLDQLGQWIDQLAGYTKPGGCVILLFNFQTPLPDAVPHLLWRQPWLEVAGGGEASLTYELLADLPERGTQRIRRAVRTRGVPGAPARIEECYELRVWGERDLEMLPDVLSRAVLAEVLDANTGAPLSRAEGECYLVFEPG